MKFQECQHEKALPRLKYSQHPSHLVSGLFNCLPRAELPQARVTPLNSGLYFRFALCSRVTQGRVVRDCEMILRLKNNPGKKQGCEAKLLNAFLCLSTNMSCQMRWIVFVCFIVLNE